MTTLLDQGALTAARAWCAEAPVEVHEQIGSTNERMAELAAAGAPEGSLVVALSQLAGRGRHGRTWESPRGGLYFSLLLHPSDADLRGLPATLLAGLALCTALDAFTSAHARPELKWPNDVLIAGRKVSGILGEMSRGTTSSEGSASSKKSACEAGSGEVGYRLVLGVGVNVACVELPSALRDTATSLESQGSNSQDPDAQRSGILCAFLTSFGDLLARSRGPEGSRAEILAEVSARMPALGKPIRLQLPNRVASGIFRGLAPSGGLILEDAEGARRTHLAGEVQRARPFSPSPLTTSPRTDSVTPHSASAKTEGSS